MTISPAQRKRINKVSEVLARYLAETDLLVDHSPAPKRLYHYTNTTGLLGILASGTLWATESRYLNDASEMQYATRRLVPKVIVTKLADEEFDLDLVNVLMQVKQMPFTTQDDWYIACFCEHDDLLNQWRVYSGNEGYAIGFDTKAVAQTEDMRLVRVEYDKDAQVKALRRVLDAASPTIKSELAKLKVSDEAKKAAINDCYVVVMMYFTYLVTAFKHPSFKVEHEWRLISEGKPVTPLHRAGQYGLTPYVPVKPRDAKGKLPIVSITHGPTTRPQNAKRAIWSLLDQHGYDADKIDIRGSKLPIRI